MSNFISDTILLQDGEGVKPETTPILPTSVVQPYKKPSIGRVGRGAELIDFLHRGGSWAHYWTPNTGEFYIDKHTDKQIERKLSLWFPADKRPTVPASWEDRNVYFCVNPQTYSQASYIRARISTTASINVLFAEFDVKDYGSKAAILAHLETLSIYPTAVIDSGGGYHAYWILERPVIVDDSNRTYMQQLQAAWVTLVGGDFASRDLARVLRVPGTQNRKEHFAPDYPVVKVHEARFDRLYRLVDFERLTEELRQAKFVAPTGHITGDVSGCADEDVIVQFKEKFLIADVLSAYGYSHAHGDRWVRPGGESGSVQVKLQENVSFHHNTNDLLHKCSATGSVAAIDPFEAFTMYEHNGNHKEAFIAAKKTLGLWRVAKPAAPEMPDWMNDAPDPFTDDGGAGVVVTDSDSDAEQQEVSADDHHPLDVEVRKDLKLGWADEYANLAAEMNASPRQFHVLAALAVAATAMQGKGRLRMAFAPAGIYPNLYSSIVAPTTVFGKTTAIDHARYVLQAAGLQKLIPATHSTSEGLIKALSTQPTALMLRNEISGLLSSDKTRYLKDYKTDLIELYDCKPYGRRLSNEEIKVDRPYLNILGGTTPEEFYANVAQRDWTSGLLVRFLYALPGTEDKPNFKSTSGMYSDDYDTRMKQIARKLKEIDQQKEVDFQLATGVFETWSDWRAKGLEYAYNQQDNMSMAVMGRYAVVALKFAMILSAVNGDWGRINSSTMQTAMALADNFKAVIYRILTESDKYKVTGAKVQKVFAVINTKNTGNGVTERMIKQFTKLTSVEIAPCLDEMKAIGVISDKRAGRTIAFFAMVKELPIRKWNSA